MTITRRGFIRTTSLAAGFTLSFRLPGALADEHDGFRPNAFLHIGEDEAITVFAVRLEMGQGVRTLLPMMIAEELDVDWGSIRVEQATPGGPFKEIQLHTSGSSSSSETFMDLRRAGAAAREMLIQAAAGNWGVEPGSCRTERGAVIHPATGRRRTYGQLAAAAARQSVPKEPALKPRTAFRMLGTPMKRIDGPAIVTGRAPYGLDVRVPGMLYASIERAPTLGATMRRFDAEAALKLPGVRYVVPVTRGILQGVAVVADDTWSAMRARRALHIEWEPGPAANFDSDRYLASLPAALERASFAVRHEGDADAALAGATRRVDATYVFPFQAHAPMESMNCTADVRQASAEIWVPTQTDVRTLDQAAKVTGLPRDAITVHCALMGGGFGRRLFADYVAEAAEISQRLGRPVQVCWTREDDMRRGYFQPATAQRFTAGLDAAGRLVALVHRTSASDLTIYDIHGGRNIWTDPPKPPRAADAYARDQSPWGAYDNPYAIAHLRVDCADVTSPVPTGPWRAVEYPSTVFGRESFLDELAHAAGADPIAFRLALLPPGVGEVGPYRIDRTRLARVLEAVRDRARWTEPLPSSDGRRRGRGVAVNTYHTGSYLAMVAEVSTASDGSDLRVERITTAVDCGIALNPLGVEGQTESGIAWGLSAALYGRMDFRQGAPVQSTFGDFHVLRIDQMPALDTVILDSGAAPGGYGEHPVPLVAPAVANALFAATGRRVRELPLTA